MRTILLFTAFLLSTLSYAQVEKTQKQERKTKMERQESFTPEQQAELQVKKMILDLNLNSKQQEDVKKLLITQAKKRETFKNEIKTKKEKGEKLSKDERFNLHNNRLDEKIAVKEEMKKILTDEQFKKWEENSAERQVRKQKMIAKHKANKFE
jgi:protein CpxP